ncbi:MAG TPA: ComF family protein [Myxococcota bacterium]|nr:ComF family protein [Myxococcota bacterium]
MADRPQQDGALTGPRRLLEALLLAVFPPHCLACRRPQARRPDHGLCALCLDLLPRNRGLRCPTCDVPAPAAEAPCARCLEAPPAFARLRAPLAYRGTARALVAAGKFRGREEVWRPLAHVLATDGEVHRLLQAADVLVPVPLGPERGRRRGYNQSAHLARALGRLSGKPVAHALRRHRETSAQSRLSLAMRRQNVREAFAPTQALSGTALLIDDVVTSGETVHQAARALRLSGVQHVAVVAVARAIERNLGTVITCPRPPKP